MFRSICATGRRFFRILGHARRFVTGQLEPTTSWAAAADGTEYVKIRPRLVGWSVRATLWPGARHIRQIEPRTDRPIDCGTAWGFTLEDARQAAAHLLWHKRCELADQVDADTHRERFDALEQWKAGAVVEARAKAAEIREKGPVAA